MYSFLRSERDAGVGKNSKLVLGSGRLKEPTIPRITSTLPLCSCLVVRIARQATRPVEQPHHLKEPQ